MKWLPQLKYAIIHMYMCSWNKSLNSAITLLLFYTRWILRTKKDIQIQHVLLCPRPRPHISGYFWIRNFFFPDTKISASTRYVITAYSYRIRPSTYSDSLRIHWGFTKLSHQALVRPGLTQNRRGRHCFPTRLSCFSRPFCPVDNVKSLQMSSRLLA